MILLIIGVCGLVVAGVTLVSAARERETAEQRIRRQLLEADQEINPAYRAARRAMNDAARQSWRNLTD